MTASQVHNRRRITVFGVDILDWTVQEAIAEMERCLVGESAVTRTVFFVNANTLNLAWADVEYLRVLRSADWVFGDGTGVRWAARLLHDVSLRDNVNGTDLVPRMLQTLSDRGLRYYLLGTTAAALERASEYARRAFAGWQLMGAHHGYIDIDDCAPVVEQINSCRPHLLLVGMGNPKQERWLYTNAKRLRVPVCMGIGGLLTYWAGDLDRAPMWMRRWGLEWLHLLRRQKHKAGRYLVGNPQFLSRMARERWLGPSPAARVLADEP